jgi:hypothetical protein
MMVLGAWEVEVWEGFVEGASGGARRRRIGGGPGGGCARRPVGTSLYLDAVGAGNPVAVPCLAR